MFIHNYYGPMLVVVGFVNGQPGEVKTIMPDTPEEIFGPPFLRDERGRVVSRYSIPGQLIVVNAGHNDNEQGVLVMPAHWQIVHDWTELDAVRYRVVIQDFRLAEKQQRSSR